MKEIPSKVGNRRFTEVVTVADLIAALQQLPPDAHAYAYQGEENGVIVEKSQRVESKHSKNGHLECKFSAVIETDEEDPRLAFEPCPICGFERFGFDRCPHCHQVRE